MEKFYKKGLTFTCTNCSLCCKGESGYVFLSKLDLERLAKHFKMSEADFLENHVRTVPYNDHLRLSLLETEDMACEFWDASLNGCSVYASRPTQCRTYPFWSSITASQANWNLEASSCPGIGYGNKIYSEAEIDQILTASQDNSLIMLKNI